MFSVKNLVRRKRRQVPGWEKIFATTYMITHSYLEHINNSQNSTVKIRNPIRKEAKCTKRHFTEKNIQTVTKHMKRCTTSLAIKGIAN